MEGRQRNAEGLRARQREHKVQREAVLSDAAKLHWNVVDYARIGQRTQLSHLGLVLMGMRWETRRASATHGRRGESVGSSSPKPWSRAH